MTLCPTLLYISMHAWMHTTSEAMRCVCKKILLFVKFWIYVHTQIIDLDVKKLKGIKNISRPWHRNFDKIMQPDLDVLNIVQNGAQNECMHAAKLPNIWYNSFQCFSNLKLFECNLIINLLNLATVYCTDTLLALYLNACIHTFVLGCVCVCVHVCIIL